jgi:REP element-mobilizing transposase RayT
MPRRSRIHSLSGVYHIMMRGNEKMDIFMDDEDKSKLMDILFDKQVISGYKLYAYCLMRNHIHLVLKECKETLAQCMKRINVSYAYYFNKKYCRVGHLFQDRFKSECIDDESYLLSAIRYIHNNSVTAKIAAKPGDYPWSSYNGYIKNTDNSIIISRDEVLSLFSSNAKLAVRQFIIFSQKNSDDNFIDFESDEERRFMEINSFSAANTCIEKYLHKHGISLDRIRDKDNISDRDELIAYL